MIWKKNVISYIMWFLYVLLAEILVLICTDELGRSYGLPVYVNALIGFTFAAFVGVLVLLIRKLWTRSPLWVNRYPLFGFLAEAVVCVLLLAVGLGLRIFDMEAMTQGASYFEAAQVTYGQSIPQVVHGAVYIYLQVLHGLFLIVGNHFVAGIWLQIVLQMLAFLVLYFVVRKMSGVIAALMTLGFGMCAPMMVRYALELSPEMLYFLLLVLTLSVFMIGYNRKLHPALFLVFGALAAVMTYLDITGILLFLFAASIPFNIREESAGVGRKMAALGCTVVSYAGVFAGTILLDALSSGKVFGNVWKAWTALYSVKYYEATDIPFSIEEIILLGFLLVGIFSFWCNKRAETISVSICGVIGFILLAMRFTKEMPGDFYLILMLVVMASTFVGQVFSPVVSPGGIADGDVAEDESMAVNDDTVMNLTEVSKAEQAKVVEPVKENRQEVVQEPTKPVIQFIENPLPLPKKHEKRVLNYAVELTDETAEFDIDVADDDDYDR